MKVEFTVSKITSMLTVSLSDAQAAARDGNIEFFRPDALSREELGKLLRQKDEDGRSLLHAAAAYMGTAGTQNVLSLLVSIDDHAVNDVDDEGWAPLHTAASVGSELGVAVLLKAGANVNASNSGKRTALHYAASKGHSRLLAVLLEGGADVEARDVTGSTALHRAASAGKQEAVRVLLDSGRAQLEARDGGGCTPLLLALASGHKNLALLLAAHGAGLQAVGKEGESVAAVAGAELQAALRAAAEHGLTSGADAMNVDEDDV